MATAMDGLFGASPYEVEQQQYQKVQEAARQFAQMSPLDKAGMMMYQGGAGLGRIGAEALGGVNVPVQQAQQNQQAIQGADLQTPEGLRELAKKLLAMGNQRGAYLAAQKAQEIESNAAKAALDVRKEERLDKELQEVKIAGVTNRLQVEKDRLAANIARWAADANNESLSIEQRREAVKLINATKMQIAQMDNDANLKGITLRQSYGTESGNTTGKIDFSKMKDSDKWRIVKEQGDDKRVVEKSSAETEDVSKLASSLLTHPGLPDITGWSSLTNVAALPNGKAKGALTLLQSLKSKAATVGRALASESGKLGNMALGEWKIVAEDIANLDPASPEFEGQVKRIVQKAEDIESRVRRNYDETYSIYEGLNPALSASNLPPQAPSTFNPTPVARPQVSKPANAINGVTSPTQVKQLFQSGKLTREQAKAILADMDTRGVK